MANGFGEEVVLTYIYPSLLKDMPFRAVLNSASMPLEPGSGRTDRRRWRKGLREIARMWCDLDSE
eukprot:7873230-Pyramimonas_sp.AAC.1